MRLLYNRKQSFIDENMSETNIGGRKGRRSIDNVFILNGIICDVLSSKRNKSIVIQSIDYKQMFDGIILEDALMDLFDLGIEDDTLNILHAANKNIKFSVKSSNGVTEESEISSSVLQGDVWSPSMAAVDVERMGKDVEDQGLGYMYRGELLIGVMGLLDDTLSVSEVGHQSYEMNQLMNTKSAMKRLQFGVDKCKVLFVGSNQKSLQIAEQYFVDHWSVTHENVNGEAVLKETYEGKVQMTQVSDLKYLGHVISSSKGNMPHIF